MTQRTYMGIDARADHSLRIPRPDLSIRLGVPNACNRCHFDKSLQWADDQITRWYGPGRRAHYGTTIAAGRNAARSAHRELLKLAADSLCPVIVRATALSLLSGYPGRETDRAYASALMDEEALIRRTAVGNIQLADRKRQSALLAALLYDPVKAVRIEAARRMAEIPDPGLDAGQKKTFADDLAEYVKAMQYSADFAFGRYNLANLYISLQQPEKAVTHFRAAIGIDSQFYPAKVNLAMLYNRMGKKDAAETLLREVAASHPEIHDVQYSLGLLLAEQKKYAEAARYLKQAARGLPDRARIHYNLGLLLQHLRQDADAQASLLKALELEPDNLDYLYALADFYLKRGKLRQARSVAEIMVARHPDRRVGHDILEFLRKKWGRLQIERDFSMLNILKIDLILTFMGTLCPGRGRLSKRRIRSRDPGGSWPSSYSGRGCPGHTVSKKACGIPLPRMRLFPLNSTSRAPIDPGDEV